MSLLAVAEQADGQRVRDYSLKHLNICCEIFRRIKFKWNVLQVDIPVDMEQGMGAIPCSPAAGGDALVRRTCIDS